MSIESKIFDKTQSHTILDFITKKFVNENKFEKYMQADPNYLNNIKILGHNSCKGKYYSFLNKIKNYDTRIKDLYEGFELTNACQKCLLKWR